MLSNSLYFSQIMGIAMLTGFKRSPRVSVLAVCKLSRGPRVILSRDACYCGEPMHVRHLTVATIRRAYESGVCGADWGGLEGYLQISYSNSLIYTFLQHAAGGTVGHVVKLVTS